jgi:predicted MPP superfamily phosphohydrolase
LPISSISGVVLLSGVRVALAWNDNHVWAGGIFGLLALGDGFMLTSLPRRGRSYGPAQLPWLSLLGLRLIPALLIPTLWNSDIPALVATMLLQLLLSMIAIYACWVEPAQLGLTRVTVRSAGLNGCPPLSLLHISDLHLERTTGRERELLRLVEAWVPDLIVLTGDYLNISFAHDETAQQQARDLLQQLRAPMGVYAISGSPSVDPTPVVAQLLEGLNIAWLRDRVVVLNWHGCSLLIVGIECTADAMADAHTLRQLLNGQRGERTMKCFTLLLYHTPDIMPAAEGVDLYLAGHTHGGQLRLPFYGALVTASRLGKQYEMGVYREGRTTLYVNRGVGMEGKGAPRARFLCPPEIALFTLKGTIDG